MDQCIQYHSVTFKEDFYASENTSPILPPQWLPEGVMSASLSMWPISMTILHYSGGNIGLMSSDKDAEVEETMLFREPRARATPTAIQDCETEIWAHNLLTLSQPRTHLCVRGLHKPI